MPFRTSSPPFATAFAGYARAPLATQAQVVGYEPTKVQPGSYVLDLNHTQIEFSLSHLGFATFYGRFANPFGSLTLSQ